MFVFVCWCESGGCVLCESGGCVLCVCVCVFVSERVSVIPLCLCQPDGLVAHIERCSSLALHATVVTKIKNKGCRKD